MKEYIIRRLLWMVPTVIGITLITFLIMRAAPGDPAKLGLGIGGESLKATEASKKVLEEHRRLLGLDKPLWQAYLSWAGRLAVLDFGNSYKDQRPVSTIILERLPVTLQINLVSILLAYVISIPVGVHSAVRGGRLSERVTTVVLFVLYSLPTFWVAYILIYFFALGGKFGIFPAGQISSTEAAAFGLWRWTLDRAWHLALPVICLTYGSFAGLSRYMRSGMIEVLRQDYIRTARAKGLSERVVVFKHALRNSMIPIITLLAGLLPGLLGGSVIVETIFNVPGMGLLAFDAVKARDYPVIMADSTVMAVLTLFGILMSDIMYAIVDPRIKYD